MVGVADFIQHIGGTNAATFVNGVGVDNANIINFISTHSSDMKVMYTNVGDNIDILITCLSVSSDADVYEFHATIKAIYELAENTMKSGRNGKDGAGFTFENEDLSGKDLSGLKITSLTGCTYTAGNPPNFSRCDLTGCDMTQLTIV